MGCRVVANLANKKVKSTQLDPTARNSKEMKAKNLFGKFPILETKEGIIHESMAIAKYLAHGTKLLGGNDLQRAQIDMWTNWALELSATTNKVCFSILGTNPITKEDFNEGL